MAYLAPLTAAFTYTWSREHKDGSITFNGFPVKGRYLPYASIFFTLLVNGPEVALQQATGTLSAALYGFLKKTSPRAPGHDFLPTPQFLQRIFPGGPISYAAAAPGVAKGFGTVYRNSGSGSGQSTASGSKSSSSRPSGRLFWGGDRGHRLGSS